MKFIDENNNCVEKCEISQYTYLDSANGNKCFSKCPENGSKYIGTELKQ